ncbi:TetR/AcrR family transcriptional regulator [Streptomyces sp. TRM 70351]|uniref:TetR/AcrR family transcriptional regulator n=1 Tax=Streptomyces sp. TRM 70351 TaxID=3116552 RepID=UPI002E7B1D65|nr:TetR/AcrR family transcriptional regulator [Streptomyces sp. TRM 70351]MEE1930424.1 TetR/AcrR family transcriptional regulator [Streptomyces sp. TRM 70351]
MQVRAEQTRQSLIDAAAALFDTKGPRDSGLLEISRAAGVSKGALYFHFGSKQELVGAVWEEARNRVRRLARDHIGPQPATLDATFRFVSALTTALRRDVVVRAGLRLEAEGGLETDADGGGMRREWLRFLSRNLTGADGNRAPSDLVAAVTIGLETLGRQDPSWWSQETVSGIWHLLSGLRPPEVPAGTAENSVRRVTHIPEQNE